MTIAAPQFPRATGSCGLGRRLTRLAIMGLAFSMLMDSIGSEAYAQLVQVGPGFVRAPFVRIYTAPDGSSHIRAPFVAINTPPRMPPPHVIIGPALPDSDVPDSPGDTGGRVETSGDWPLPPEVIEQLDRPSLRGYLQQSVDDLEHQLRSLGSKSDGWLRYLRVALLRELVLAPLPSDKSADSSGGVLASLLQRWDEVEAHPHYERITSLPAFSTTLDLLRAYAHAEEPNPQPDSSAQPESIPAPTPDALPSPADSNP